jgi:hypothetical protein
MARAPSSKPGLSLHRKVPSAFLAGHFLQDQEVALENFPRRLGGIPEAIASPQVGGSLVPFEGGALPLARVGAPEGGSLAHRAAALEGEVSARRLPGVGGVPGAQSRTGHLQSTCDNLSSPYPACRPSRTPGPELGEPRPLHPARLTVPLSTQRLAAYTDLGSPGPSGDWTSVLMRPTAGGL